MTRIKGENLDSDVLEDLTRSAAASGNDAKARIQSPGDQKPVLKHLTGNPITIQQENIATEEDKQRLLEHIRRTYKGVRGTESKQ